MVLRCILLLAALIPTLAAASDLPRVMSTNLCADMLLLSLADPAQVVSVSARSQDPARTSFASQAAAFPVNTGSAEEVIAARITNRRCTSCLKTSSSLLIWWCCLSPTRPRAYSESSSAQ